MSTAPLCKLCHVRHWNTEPHHLKPRQGTQPRAVVPSVLGTQLVLFDAARRAVEEARTVDEVKDVRDRAEAIRLYMRQAGESLQMQNGVAEIKLRAERKIGDMLSGVEGVRPGNPQLFQAGTIGLKGLGIKRTQSHRWQAEASVSEAEFERYVAETKSRDQEITSAGLYRLSRHPVAAAASPDIACPHCGWHGPRSEFKTKQADN